MVSLASEAPFPATKIARVDNPALVWVLSGSVFLGAVLWCAIDGITFSPTMLYGFLTVYALTALTARLCYITPHLTRVGSAISGLGQLWVSSAGLAVIQYPAARIRFPLVDSALIRFDGALDFDWPSHFAWVMSHPSVRHLFELAYHSYGVFVPLIIIGIGLWNPRHLQHCLLANIFAALACAILAALFPAIGGSGVFLPHDQWPPFIPAFLEARAGTLQLDLNNIQGIEQFPSYHATLAVMLAYGLLCLPRLISVPLIAFEMAMLVSALAIGGHHLADVVAGTAIALACIATVEWLSRPTLQPTSIRRKPLGTISLPKLDLSPSSSDVR